MFKVMVLLKRKPGLSLAEFIEHYETVHAPLGVKYQTKMTRYIRHYLHPAAYPLDGTVIEAEYDVLTEIHFSDRQNYEDGMALMMAPEANAIISADEQTFMDLPRNRLVFVEDRESEIPNLTSTPQGAFRSLVLLKRKPGMSLEEFIDHYENNHAPLGVKYATTMSRYIRHFLRPAPYPLDGSITEAAYDVATECWFENQADAEKATELMMAPEANRVIGEDEIRFIDIPTRRFMTVETHESVLPWISAS